MPVRPCDEPLLEAGLEHLSAHSLYTRFFTGMTRLGTALLHRLADADQVDHLAWAAIDPTRPDLPGVGIGHAIRLAAEPTRADIALTVIDAYQRQGIGSLLLALLYAQAPAHGISTFSAQMLEANYALVRDLRHLGAATHFADDCYEILFPVRTFDSPPPGPDAPLAAFQHIVQRLSAVLADIPAHDLLLQQVAV
ncbi:MAG: hypothetical protein OHK0039_03630 [Bacteroidia bacterium]